MRRVRKGALLLAVAGMLIPHCAAYAQESVSPSGPPEAAQTPQSQTPQNQAPPPPQEQVAAPVSHYDEGLFERPIPRAQLAFVKQFAGGPSSDLYGDREFRKLMRSFIPDCIFHYGRDMSLSDALDMVFNGSSAPVQIRDGRYLILSGDSGPYLMGRAFLWIDLEKGIGLGGFFFHPTNGEPTPALNVFSRQVREDSLALSQLPPEFAFDLGEWTWSSGIPPATTRYFLTGANQKILLEHDEDYCAPADERTVPDGSNCEQMNADASDMDMNAAYYLEQTHHATNATAWMIQSDEEVSWIQVRESTCGAGPDPLGCHVRMTHEHIHVMLHRRPVLHR